MHGSPRHVTLSHSPAKTVTKPSHSAATRWRPSPNWGTFLAAGLIVLVTVVAYRNSFSGPFVFDDEVSIQQNPTIRQLWPIWKPLSPPNHGGPVTGRPLANLSFAVNYAIDGLNVWGYHFANLAIHILAALLLFGILRRTFLLPSLGKTPIHAPTCLALAIALLWAVHPLQTESVTYMVQRAESLVGLFYLLTLYCVIRGASSARERVWYTVAVLACLLGMASKEVMVSAPVIVLLYDRTFLAGSFREAWRRRYGVYLALASTWLLLGWLVIRRGHPRSVVWLRRRGRQLDLFLYSVRGCHSLPEAIRLAAPVVARLCSGHPPHDPRNRALCNHRGAVGVGHARCPLAVAENRLSGGLVLCHSSADVELRADSNADCSGTSDVSSAGGSGDRGDSGRIRCLLETGVSRIDIAADGSHRGACVVIAGALTLGTLTYHRNADYRSGLSIWQDTVFKAPRNARADCNLGTLLGRHGRFDEAITQLQQSLEMGPDCVEAHNNLGLALAGLGRFDEAIAEHQKALEIKPDSAEAHDDLGRTLAGRGQVDEAIAHYRKALEIEPDFATAHNNLGLALAGRGQIDEAIAHYRKALKTEPNFAEAHNNFGVVLGQSGRFDEAVSHFRQALKIKPDYAEACNNLGNALAGQGKIAAAVVQSRAAVRLQPNELGFVNQLAWMLATYPDTSVRNGAEAVTLAQRAVQLSGGREPAVLGTLAAAYAEAGRFPEAVQTARKALDLAVQQNNQSAAKSIRPKFACTNRALRIGSRPFHESKSRRRHARRRSPLYRAGRLRPARAGGRTRLWPDGPPPVRQLR